jgi:hypothetical protein
MRQILLIIVPFVFFACNKSIQEVNTKVLQTRIDNLENKLADTYKPGFGEFMSSIQAHHYKLWFAGKNKNWKLANFEVKEIMEAIENIQKFQSERKESLMIGMINPVLDSMNTAILKKDPILFESSYILLTNTCNACHRDANLEFNVVKIPDHQPFSNQDFHVNEPK